ncbi:MAG TPA: VTT domain-containing protein [Gammaproteobacteria bacterium]
MLVFALGTVLFVPGAIFGLAGGLLFGPLWGTVFNLAGAMLGATAAFLAARYVAADWVRRRAAGWLERIMAGVEAEGWRFVAFVRFVPLFPFNLLNYALGLTRIPLRHYVLASLLCMAPGTVAYTWLGYAGREALAGDDAAIRSGLIALALLATVAFLPRLVRRLRGAEPAWIEVEELARRLADRGDIAVIDVRGVDEFAGPLGHVATARNIPIAELPSWSKELEPLKHQPIAIVCLTDKRSAKAAALLRAADFDDVRVLRGGMARWSQKGLPVQGPATPLQRPFEAAT